MDSEHQHIIDRLQALIGETKATLTRFEQEGMNIGMAEDYKKLLDILADVIKQQREHTSELLSN